MRFAAAFIFISALPHFGCAAATLGKDAATGVMQGVVPAAPALGRGLVEGAREGLAAEETGSTLKELASQTVDGLRDGVTREETVRRLQKLEGDLIATARLGLAATEDDLLGARLQAHVGGLRESVLGEATKRQVVGVRESLVGDAAKTQVGALIDEAGRRALGNAAQIRAELVGPPLRAEVSTLIQDSVQTFANAWDVQIAPRLVRSEREAQRAILRVIFVAGGVVLALIVALAWLVRRHHRVRRVLHVLTASIDGLPERTTYDQLVAKISERCKEAALEKTLREILVAQGINDAKDREAAKPSRKRRAKSSPSGEIVSHGAPESAR